MLRAHRADAQRELTVAARRCERRAQLGREAHVAAEVAHGAAEAAAAGKLHAGVELRHAQAQLELQAEQPPGRRGRRRLGRRRLARPRAAAAAPSGGDAAAAALPAARGGAPARALPRIRECVEVEPRLRGGEEGG